MTFDPKTFFDICRKGVMGPTLDQFEVIGANAVLDAMKPLHVSWTAYALATAWHETAHTMQPIKERGGNAYFFRMYDIKGHRPAVARELGNTEPGDGAKFAGRGYVQLTGRSNYKKASVVTGVDLIENPDLAMRADVAGKIMRHGMEQGWFTGKALRHYLPPFRAEHKQFVEARRIINRLDRAEDIADYAVQFQEALVKAGW